MVVWTERFLQYFTVQNLIKKKWFLEKKVVSTAELIDSDQLNITGNNDQMTNIFSEKYYACKKILILAENDLELASQIKNLGGQVDVLNIKGHSNKKYNNYLDRFCTNG